MRRIEHAEIRDIPDYTGIGVYALIDEHGRRYIGSSLNVRRRIIQHCSSLRRGWENSKLQEAYNNGAILRAEVLRKIPDGIWNYELLEMEKQEIINAGGWEVTYNVAYNHNILIAQRKKLYAYVPIRKQAQKQKQIIVPRDVDEIKLRVPKGRKADIAAHAKRKGYNSVNALMSALLRADMGLSEEEWEEGQKED